MRIQCLITTQFHHSHLNLIQILDCIEGSLEEFFGPKETKAMMVQNKLNQYYRTAMSPQVMYIVVPHSIGHQMTHETLLTDENLTEFTDQLEALLTIEHAAFAARKTIEGMKGMADL